MLKSSLAFAGVFMALAGAVGAARAAATRTFVSGHGTDGGACSVTTPCRTFAYALTQTAPQGEILVLDSAGYGTVNIMQAVSIVAPVGIEGSMTVPSSQNGITISAGSSDAITLSGLTIDGDNNAGTNGIVFNSGASLTVDKCFIRRLAQNGILLQPNSSQTADMLVRDTILLYNGVSGISILPPASNASIVFSIVQTIADNNAGSGIVIGGSAAANISGSIQASHADANSNTGIVLNSLFFVSSTTAIIRNSTADNNATGISVGTGSAAYLVGSEIQLNTTTDLTINTQNNGAVSSYGNNDIGNISGGANLTEVPLK